MSSKKHYTNITISYFRSYFDICSVTIDVTPFVYTKSDKSVKIVIAKKL